MFTKFDKNLANYLATNKLYIDCYNNNIQNNTNNISNENSCGQQVGEASDSNGSHLPESPKDMGTAVATSGVDEMATEDNSDLAKGHLNNNEVDSVINSLPDMNEIESFDGHSEKGQFQASCSHKQFELNSVAANNTKYHMYSTKLHQPHSHHPNLQHQHQPSSPVSSMSSSSASVSPILSEIGGNSSTYKQHMHSAYKDFNNNSNGLDMGMGMGISSSLPNKKIFNRNIHCVKEKIRRDRIKFSCNELRRLIPNLNGVKTDMASLLETSVLWIQLINSNIPEQLLVNVQNKLEGLKLLRSNKHYMSANGHKTGSALSDLAAGNKMASCGQKPRNKSVSTGGNTRSNNAEQQNSPRELHLKQEVNYNTMNVNQPVNIGGLGLASLNSSLNSSFMSSIDTSPPPANLVGSAPGTKPSLQQQNPLEHNFMSKPSKWLSLTQQHKYSEQLYAAAAASHRTAPPSSYAQDQELVDQRTAASGFLANASNVLGNYGDCDFFKMAAKKSDLCVGATHSHSNNLYLGQVAFNDQLGENFCASHSQLPASVSIDTAENSGMSCLSNVYFQASQQQQQQQHQSQGISSLSNGGNNCFY